MPKLQRDSSACLDKLRFIVSVRKIRATTGYPGDLFECRTTKANELVTGRISYSYRVNLDVRFLDPIAKLLVSVSAVVVLAVGDYKDRFPWVPALLGFLDCEVDRVVKRSRAVRVNEHQMAENPVPRGSEVLCQPGAVIESD